METSDKTGPLRDEELKAESQGMFKANRQTRAEEWHEIEPSGEDQPDVDRTPDGTLTGGTPEGMSADDVQLRSELATYLGREIYPAVREQLIGVAMDQHAPDAVVDRIKDLPSGRQFANVNDVWEALGGHVEQSRC